MAISDEREDRKFGKSRSNQGVQRTGRDLLLLDPRFQDAALATKRAVIELIGPVKGFGSNSFDLIMKPEGTPKITPENVFKLWSTLRLVEMKATKKPIRDAALNRFFFGSDRERNPTCRGSRGPLSVRLRGSEQGKRLWTAVRPLTHSRRAS